MDQDLAGIQNQLPGLGMTIGVKVARQGVSEATEEAKEECAWYAGTNESAESKTD